MATRYKIRARVQPVEVPQIPEAINDVRLQEQRLLVPMDGSQTVGDLYYEIQRIYGDLYNKAGELRIRCLETEDGELLHTSLRISDCFERRIDSNASSQWTVIARRQAPSQEELEAYKRNIRQFSFDDLSFARPQIPFLEVSVAPQEVSASPLKNQPTIRAPIQADAADDVIPSTERDVEPETRSLAVRQAQYSPTLVPNSQKAPGQLGDSRDAPQAKVGSKQIHPKASTISKAITSKPSKAPIPRKDVYDITTVDEPIQIRKKASPDGLPENRHSSANAPGTPIDDRPGARKMHPLGRRTSSIERSTEQSTAKLHASLAKERAETQKLVATLPTTSSPRQSQKLTPFFPRSATKLTSGSAQSESITNATSTGVKLLQAETPSSLKTQQPIGKFAPDRFKETDLRVLSSFQSDKNPNKESEKGASPNVNKKITDNLDDVEDDEAQINQTKIPDLPIDERHDEIEEVSNEDDALPNGISSPSIQKQPKVIPEKKKRGRPPKDSMAKSKAKATSPKDSPKSGSVSPEDEKTEEDGQPPAKKKRGRPRGSTKKSKSDTTPPKIDKVKPVIDVNGQPIKKGRGRPPGSKKKVKTTETGSPTPISKDSLIATTEKKKPAESDMESDTEQTEANQKANQNGSTNETKLNASTNTGVHKRKPDVDETVEESSKRTKTTAGLTGLANVGAMDESEDREAVVSANDTRLFPNVNRETSTMRSYSRSPAKEVTSSSSDDSLDADPASETSKEDDSSVSQTTKTVKNTRLTANPMIRDVPDVKILSPPRQSAITKTDKTSNHVSIPQSRDDNENHLSPTGFRIPSSADQAAAQLQSEDSASMTASTPTQNGHKPNTPKRPVPFSSARSKYLSFSDIKQQAIPRSKEYSQNIRTNPEFDQKMRQHPKNLQSFTDDSNSSSDSDSDSDDARPKKDNAKGSHSKKTEKGFHELLNWKQNK